MRVNVQQIKELIGGVVSSFTIRTSDGHSYEVPHPDFVAIGQRVVVVIGANDRVSHLDPTHITAIDKNPSRGSG